MRNELTNLIPYERQRAFARGYYVRIAVVAAVLATCILFAAGALLTPTYIYLSSAEESKMSRLSSIETSLASADGSELSARLTELSEHVTAILALEKSPSASKVIRDMLDVSRVGITLSGITYTPAGAGKGSTLAKKGTIAVTGVATTRDSLRNYQLALQSAAFSEGADLPVSAYAKDSNIPFTITISLVL